MAGATFTPSLASPGAVDKYGTHAARPAANTVADGYIYSETDTGNTYQAEGNAWVQVAIASVTTTAVSNAGGELTSHKDAANGYAGLDSSGLLKTPQLPGSAVTISSVAATNGISPPLSNGHISLSVVTEDITAALQADITAGKGVIVLPDGRLTVSSTLTNPTGAAGRIEFIGQGERRTFLQLANGVNADLLNFSPATIPVFRKINFDGNRANNTAGYTVNLPDTGTYQGAAEFWSCSINRCGAGALYDGYGRNSLLLVECALGPGSIINGTDSRFHGSACGSGVLANEYLLKVDGTNFKCAEVDFFNSLGGGIYIGFNAVQTFWHECKINNHAFMGMFFDQWAGGLAFQNIPNNHEIIGCTFSGNSQTATNTYSDILLKGVAGINIDANFRFESSTGPKPKYHVEDQVVNNPAGGSASRVRLSARCLSVPLGANPAVQSYATGVTNVTDLSRLDKVVCGTHVGVTL